MYRVRADRRNGRKNITVAAVDLATTARMARVSGRPGRLQWHRRTQELEDDRSPF